jgi:hypothetical protein
MSPAFWSEHEHCYVAFIRTWKDDGKNTRSGWGGNLRWVGRVTSPDFVHWSKVELMDLATVPQEQLYNNNTSPYFRAPHLYIGLMGRIVFNRAVATLADAERIGMDPRYSRDCSEPVLITSRGGTRYDRIFLEAFVRNGIGAEHWTSRSNYPALNIVPTGPHEMSFYVQHSYGQPGCRLVRYELETDRLASVHAPFQGGELITKPLLFSGRNLALNFSTSVVGGLRVEVQDPAGKPIPGYSLAESVEAVGNEIERVVGWKGRRDLAPLHGGPVRLRFVLRESDLFALRFK